MGERIDLDQIRAYAADAPHRVPSMMVQTLLAAYCEDVITELEATRAQLAAAEKRAEQERQSNMVSNQRIIRLAGQVEAMRMALERIVENRVNDGGPCGGDPSVCDCSECIARAALSATLATPDPRDTVVEAAIAYHDQWAVPSTVEQHQARHAALMATVAAYLQASGEERER